MHPAQRRTARAIVIRDDMILLMERWRDGLHYFSIPGGGIEDGETPESAALRELAEETSIQVALERLVFVVQAPDANHQIFLASYISGEPALAADAPENLSSPRNRWQPGWQQLAQMATLPFIYWEPLRPHLLKAVQDGFPTQPVIVTSTESR